MMIPSFFTDFLLSFILFKIASSLSSYTCKDQNGNDVDWFLIYKLPDINDGIHKHMEKGLTYLYMDSNNYDGWKVSPKSINDSDHHMIAYTLNQIYYTKSDKSRYLLMYNDDPPVEGAESSYRGHTKGVQLFGSSKGFWLVHSVPRWPPPLERSYSYPESGTRNGQSMLCVTFSTLNTMKSLSTQMYFYQPNIYNSTLPAYWAQLYPKLQAVISGKSVKKAPYNRKQVLYSLKGYQFINFAKHKKWDKDLYSDFVAPSLKESIYVETWLNGEGDLSPACKSEYKVHNIRAVNPDKIFFKSSKDHSKWAISQRGERDSKGWVCIGDINRQKSQFKRAGGILCFFASKPWVAYRNGVAKVETCGSNEKNLLLEQVSDVWPCVLNGQGAGASHYIACMIKLISMFVVYLFL